MIIEPSFTLVNIMPRIIFPTSARTKFAEDHIHPSKIISSQVREAQANCTNDLLDEPSQAPKQKTNLPFNLLTQKEFILNIIFVHR